MSLEVGAIVEGEVTGIKILERLCNCLKEKLVLYIFPKSPMYM